MSNSISNPKLYGIMIGMLLTGSLNTIILKIQDDETVDTDLNGKTVNIQFHHPFFQCFFMFCGEFFCMGLYGLQLFLEKRKRDR